MNIKNVFEGQTVSWYTLPCRFRSRCFRIVLFLVFLGTVFAGPVCMGQAAAGASGQMPAPNDQKGPEAVAPSTLHHHTDSLLNEDEYTYLLNLLFPVDRAIPLGLDYTMVLRFEPHLHPESQVVLRRWHNGRVEGTIQQVVSGNAWRSAYSRVTPGQPLDFAAMAAAVEVRQSNFTVDPAQAQLWHEKMFPAMEQDFRHVRSTDREILRKGKHQAESTGTRYELWFIQQDDEVHIVSWDSEVEALPSGSFELTKWMNEIRFYAMNHWASKAPPKAASAVPAPVK